MKAPPLSTLYITGATRIRTGKAGRGPTGPTRYVGAHRIADVEAMPRLAGWGGAIKSAVERGGACRCGANATRLSAFESDGMGGERIILRRFRCSRHERELSP